MADGNNVPNRKVVVGALAGAVMAVVAWASKVFAGVEIPPEIALAGSSIIVFLIQYTVPNAE